MASTGDDENDAVLSDVEGDDPVPIDIKIPDNISVEKFREILAELDRERLAPEAAENAKSDLQISFNRLKVLCHEAIKKRDESSRQRDDALREKEEALRNLERVNGELSEEIKLKEEALRQKDEVLKQLEELGKTRESSRVEMETGSSMLVSGIEKISRKVSSYKDFGGNGLPKSNTYSGLPALAYGVIKRTNEITEELLRQIDLSLKSRNEARELVEQRNYEIAIEVSELEATISGLREEVAKKSEEIDSLKKSVDEKNGRMADLEKESLEKQEAMESELSKLRLLVSDYVSKMEIQRPFLVDQLNLISGMHEEMCKVTKTVDANKSSELSESLFLARETNTEGNSSSTSLRYSLTVTLYGRVVLMLLAVVICMKLRHNLLDLSHALCFNFSAVSITVCISDVRSELVHCFSFLIGSDASENDLPLGMQCHLMDKVGLAEGALHELTHEFQLNVSEEMRTKISALEAELVNENEKFASLITKAEKHKESQQERERKFDLQYQRTIAEALDNHLTDVQRDHEHIFQLEERRIRDDAVRGEAKRKEKALQEEKMRQERIKTEEEARLKAERAKAAAVEAEKKAAEEAASKRAAETSKDTAHAAQKSKETPDVKKEVQSSARNVIRTSENALELEKRRKQIYEELSAENMALKASVNQDYHRHGHGQIIGRLIKTISATVENVSTRSEELLKLINSPGCPKSICIQLFSEKIVSYCTNQRSSNAIFATTRLIVLVTSKIPQAMEILIAELNRVCIYTVPKHISYSEDAFRTKDAYFKAVGYEEENGKIESIDTYVERLSCYMKLYGALVQTEVGGFQNLHGLREGWAWLARFLNALPANLYTAVALHSFLEMAGFALYRRYRNQFEKLLRIIVRDFVSALKEGGSESWSTKMNKVKMSILNYIESNQYKKEPESWQLRGHLESNDFY
ncbi:hypothetical protein BUALT_Bualt17G0031200 [Buddleja alternifolia]|uniref:mRNA export factor GLE1 n=1 Tax=Buddleja alternifolia TaxID=168488 RepID=A0AAV6W6D9_9LAMI|nr:hypothetical protein BUALT_Bualt17G0031200 [Buddleja alternifolia]